MAQAELQADQEPASHPKNQLRVEIDVVLDPIWIVVRFTAPCGPVICPGLSACPGMIVPEPWSGPPSRE